MPSLTPNWSRPIPTVSWPWPDPNRKAAPTTIPVMLDEGATLPTRKTAGAAGYDLTSIGNWYLDAGMTVTMRTGVHIAIPDGYVGLLTVRSSIGERGFRLNNSVGVIDSDYRGEILASVHATCDAFIRQGERFAQLLIVPVLTADLVRVDALDNTERGTGGFGSTGRA